MIAKYSEVQIKKDNAADSLAQSIKELSTQINFGLANLYYKYPFYKNENKDIDVKADFLAITQNYNVHIFSCMNSLRYSEVEQLKETLNLLYQIIDSQLRKQAILKRNRSELTFSISTHVFCENTDVSEISDDIQLFKTRGELLSFFKDLKENIIEKDTFRTITSVIEGIDEIITPNNREILKTNSRGDILNKIENSIINYDQEQFKAVTTNIDGFQRIRGLAGTGKTIILARKVAELHRDNPNSKILYTYYTKALNEIVVKHIERLYKRFSGGKSPNWEMIDVMHSWGGARLEGVYYKMCRANNVQPLNFLEAKRKNPQNPFDYVCKELITKNSLKEYYDYVLIDEGQDFKENFYRLCHKIVKGNNIIWAYDDFQDILKTNLQSEKFLFGKDIDSQYYIDFDIEEDSSDRDIILKTCYRNSKDILTSAFSLGMGVYNTVNDMNIGVNCVQRIADTKGWEDIGFIVESGNSKEGEKMIVSRPIENSPEYKEEYLRNNLITSELHSTLQSECSSVAKLIAKDIKEEDLLPEDICVICLDNLAINDYFEILSEHLAEQGIYTFNLQTVFSGNTNFTKKDSVTLSSIYKAKGNESGSIYVIGIDAIYKSPNDVYERNKIFTAITRSKGWVHMTGTGINTQKCLDELSQLKSNEQKLIFYQPSGKHIKTISQKSRKNIKKKDLLTKNLRDLAKELNMSVEDYVKEYILKN